jgi:uncharacterized protein involved in exopolysaccharide biosynthesis
MSSRTKWLGVILAVLGMIIGVRYISVATARYSSTTAATSISPEEITRSSGTLPATEIDSFF